MPLILEYEAVLTHPDQLLACGLNKMEIGKVLDDLVAVAEPVKLAFYWRASLPDPDDDMILETAMNSSADAIVTFNLRHFAPVTREFNCAVLLPREALEQIRSSHR